MELTEPILYEEEKTYVKYFDNEEILKMNTKMKHTHSCLVME